MISRRASAILRRLVPRPSALALPALAALALLAAGCATPCEDLGKRICACQLTTQGRDACERAVKSEVAKFKTDAALQDQCDAWLSTCPNPDTNPDACAQMTTEAGKVACGLAYPVDPGPVTAP